MAEDVVSLKEYVERIFDEREKALNLAFRGQQEALAVATTALNRELEHLNKLREDVITKTDYESKHESLLSRIGAVENFNSKIIGFGAAASLIAGLVGGIVGHRFGL